MHNVLLMRVHFASLHWSSASSISGRNFVSLSWRSYCFPGIVDGYKHERHLTRVCIYLCLVMRRRCGPSGVVQRRRILSFPRSQGRKASLPSWMTLISSKTNITSGTSPKSVQKLKSSRGKGSRSKDLIDT